MSLSTETLLLPASCRTHTNELPPRSGVGDSNVRGIGYIQTYTKLHDFTDVHWDDIYHLAQRDKLTPYVSHPLALHSLEPLESLQSMQGDVTHTSIFRNYSLNPTRLKCPTTELHLIIIVLSPCYLE